MERVFDELIGLQQRQPRRNLQAVATTWALRLASNLITGLAIGVGIAAGRALAG